MKTYQSELLMVASRLLSYPSGNDENDVMNCVEEMNVSETLKQEVWNAANAVYRIPLHDLQEIYVSTFDLKEKLGLYLSAHEFGDSPKRGAALIKLQKAVNQAGYERVDDELADYIPMLYELVAITSDKVNHERLIKRLSAVTQRIMDHLPETSPYYPIMQALMENVFEAPSKEDLEKMEQQREKADLEELPYPIMYT
ncbi:nitrate reductase molybdenum cofactor assembly chaperone [Lentibacillus sp. CBA3610]|uniref:nitrate reductase molybdenum cofactor assembly chaperone n=1 Tax=Lentibacillus sp. CBA3610 TaxID=2518176 RepID=UPI00159614A0|nr:nitrate reductase molybdenum cofactor assembly chaperone [Lentibacillus sp. CBA3610]QKY68575.1 nitrate reductase molybdenum cofactor assembly chaperone [Lentibacillus sp. CBA3610]